MVSFPFSQGEKEGPAPQAWEDEGYTAGRKVPHPPIFDGPLPLPIGRGEAL